MTVHNQALLGIVAGYGQLPKVVIRAAEQTGYKIVCVALNGMADEDYGDLSSKVLYVDLGEIQKTIDFFNQEGVEQVVFAGKVDKTALLKPDVVLDSAASNLLASLPQGTDDSILLGVVRLFEAAGLKILDSTLLIQKVLPNEGVLTPWSLDDKQLKDVQFGFEMAKALGELDIGQTVVVKNRAVMAAEAIEGTDEAILRGGLLGQAGCTVVKVAKPAQDLRFDVPTIGLKTLQTCIKAGVNTLAFEAGATILLDQVKVVELAVQNKINVVAVKYEGIL